MSPLLRRLTADSIVFACLFSTLALSAARGDEVKRDIPYVSSPRERQVLDVYSPAGAKGLPVVFWIHGGGWQTGDKSDVQIKPKAFMDKGFVFVSTNYRLLPDVDMATIVRDIAKVDPLGARPHRRARRRPGSHPRHGPFRRRAARRAGLR